MRKEIVAAVFAVSILGSPVQAQQGSDPVVDSKARDIYMNVMSPFCPGRSLADCPSGKAHDLKEEIRNEVKAGKSKDTILSEIFSKYGEAYRAMPKVEGMGIVAWFAPLVFFCLGIAVVVCWLLARSRVPVVKQPSAVVLPTAIDERVEREIKKALED